LRTERSWSTSCAARRRAPARSAVNEREMISTRGSADHRQSDRDISGNGEAKRSRRVTPTLGFETSISLFTAGGALRAGLSGGELVGALVRLSSVALLGWQTRMNAVLTGQASDGQACASRSSELPTGRRGLTNREVASRLFISAHTVDSISADLPQARHLVTSRIDETNSRPATQRRSNLGY